MVELALTWVSLAGPALAAQRKQVLKVLKESKENQFCVLTVRESFMFKGQQQMALRGLL